MTGIAKSGRIGETRAMESGPVDHANTYAGRRPAWVRDIAHPGGDDSWLKLPGHIPPVGICRGDKQGGCIYVSERWCEMAGLPLEAALGTGWSQALHPEDAVRVTAEWKRCQEQRLPFRLEFRYRQPSGRVIWVYAEAMEERDADGQFVGYVGAVSDITEWRAMREALQRSHAELEARLRERTAQWEQMAMMVAASGEAIISSSLSGQIVSWNQAAERMFGFSAAEMIGQSTFVVTPANRLDEARELKARVQRGESINDFETVWVARSGELIEVALSIIPRRNASGRIVGTWAMVRDMRERKKAERRLRQLTGRLLRVQDEERRCLARELHDATAQSLAALCMNLSMLKEHDGSLSAEKRAALLTDGLLLAEGIGRDLRTHAYLLHPPLLDERGLRPALCWLIDGFAARSGIKMDLRIAPGFGRLPEAVELTIYRVVQESLSNVYRHSKSPSAEIRLGVSAGWATLEVRDAGCGLPGVVQECHGVGITGMRERLAQFGGALTIDSQPTGTTVVARLPLA